MCLQAYSFVTGVYRWPFIILVSTGVVKKEPRVPHPSPRGKEKQQKEGWSGKEREKGRGRGRGREIITSSSVFSMGPVARKGTGVCGGGAYVCMHVCACVCARVFVCVIVSSYVSLLTWTVHNNLHIVPPQAVVSPQLVWSVEVHFHHLQPLEEWAKLTWVGSNWVHQVQWRWVLSKSLQRFVYMCTQVCLSPCLCVGVPVGDLLLPWQTHCKISRIT